MTRPRIGVPRIYSGKVLPLIYPGEQAHARLDMTKVQAAIEAHVKATGAVPRSLDGIVEVEDWLVEPMPGWHGWRLRWT